MKIWAQLGVWLLSKVCVVVVGGWHSRIESLQVLMTLDFGLWTCTRTWIVTTRKTSSTRVCVVSVIISEKLNKQKKVHCTDNQCHNTQALNTWLLCFYFVSINHQSHVTWVPRIKLSSRRSPIRKMRQSFLFLSVTTAWLLKMTVFCRSWGRDNLEKTNPTMKAWIRHPRTD